MAGLAPSPPPRKDDSKEDQMDHSQRLQQRLSILPMHHLERQ